ncbi:hypothetical protein [Fuscibacter oryzae]|uniref:Uncharacterized protein n=1 Tax=Fuscibacter oryzae TaxID=2803939 RepID=A0A8J7STL7_9RHOB|nr:hypothetical protein [Fuscibacter oryzae]MBL4929331.1 hypothetical protein [Fuscibacter oryzae]
MDSGQSFWGDLVQAMIASSIISTAAWGAAGGATSAIVVKVKPGDALRQILSGSLIAGGVGTFASALLVRWGILPAEAIVAGGAGGSASYLVGVFGPAVFEVILQRIRRGRLAGEQGEDGGNG